MLGFVTIAGIFDRCVVRPSDSLYVISSLEWSVVCSLWCQADVAEAPFFPTMAIFRKCVFRGGNHQLPTPTIFPNGIHKWNISKTRVMSNKFWDFVQLNFPKYPSLIPRGSAMESEMSQLHGDLKELDSLLRCLAKVATALWLWLQKPETDKS